MGARTQTALQLLDPAQRTFGALEHRVGGWAVTEIEPHVAIRLKQIFPGIEKNTRPPISLPGTTATAADLAWFLDRYPMRMSPKTARVLDGQRALYEREQAETQAILSPDWTPPAAVGFRDGEQPYAYQAAAAELARRTGRLLLMDDLGLGKTVSAIATFADPAYLPALVVPQTHLCDQWAGKIAQFTELRTHTFKGTRPYELPAADVYICPYSRLAGWSDFAEQTGFRTIVFDEIQELRGGQGTGKGGAAKRFADAATTRLGLSATPIYNYGSEVFNVLRFVDPHALGDYWDFIREWCKQGPGGKWVVSDPQGLGAFLLEQRVALRRTGEDVKRELQPVNSIIQTIPHNAEVLAEDRDMLKRLAIQVTEGTFTERGQASRELEALIRKSTGVAKAPHVAAFVDMLIKGGRPVVLCGWHRDVYDIWAERLSHHRPAFYTGQEAGSRKNASAQAFMDGKTDLMILSLRSGAGLDGLQQRGSTIVFGELDWSPQVHAQCVGRLHRPGQTRQVDAIYLVSDGGSDPAVRGVLGLKASQSAGIVDPLRAPKDRVSDMTPIQELARRVLAEAA